jgi:hypothetical protein
METGLNVEAIRRELDEAEWQDSEPDRQERSVYLGTVFALYPSGKYYMPWACSNVTEEEADSDEEWREAVEVEFEKHGMFLTAGEGDPCDLFAMECRDVEND